MRGSSLSDPRVIRKLEREFVPISLNATDGDLPTGLPALRPWDRTHRLVPWCRIGFQCAVVIDPEGRYRLGWTGCAHRIPPERSLSFDPDLFLDYLDRCRTRFEAVRTNGLAPRLAALDGDLFAGWDWCPEPLRTRAELVMGAFRDDAALATDLAEAGLTGPPPEGWDWCGNDVREHLRIYENLLGQEEGFDLVVGEVLRGLDDPDPEVRRISAQALGEIGREAARHAARLLPLIEDEDPGVRECASRALSRIR